MKTLCRLVAGVAIAASPALAQETPRDLGDMVGARAGQAEGELARRGYRNVRSEKGDDRSYGYWWHADRRQCVTVATKDGRYSSIIATPAPDCGQPASTTRPGRPAHSGHDAPNRGDRPSRPNDAPLDTSRLQRECRMGASESFGRRPGELFVNAPIRQPSGYIVQGWYDRMKGKTTRFFNCRFDQDGDLVSVD